MAASNSARLADRLYDGTVTLIDGSDIEGSNRAAEIIRDLLQPPARRPDLVRQRAPALACELALAMPECGDRDGMERRHVEVSQCAVDEAIAERRVARCGR